MKICILNDAYEGSASPLGEVDTPCDPRPWLPDHDCDLVFLRRATSVQEVIRRAGQGYDVFINLCDGAWDEDRPGIEVVQALERLDTAFTGATTSFYEPSRDVMKRVCHAWGVRTPASVTAVDGAGVARAAAFLRFPLIVKHPSSYSSIGMTPASRVETRRELEEQAERTIESFGGALIEEFIEGRELSVLVAEDPDRPDHPTAYTPIEILFPPGESFKHFDLKWVDYHGLECVPCHDDLLAERAKDACRKLFVGLGGTSYGRCDLRVDRHGEVYMLEINPNCGVFYAASDPGTADLILQHDPAGHRGFVEQILRAALARRKRRRKPWEVRADRSGSYGTFAVRPIGRDEVIERHEGGPHHLVTRRHVEEHWGSLERAWFERYAYPLTDEVWVVWSQDPADWKPINHSCDPSAWLRGLDLVARRDLAAGDEVTLDYATFCAPPMRAFDCACGAAECRGTVRGTDHLEPFVERYGEHVSEYVRRARAAQAEVAPAAHRAPAKERRRRPGRL